jgi:hypothetical protein
MTGKTRADIPAGETVAGDKQIKPGSPGFFIFCLKRRFETAAPAPVGNNRAKLPRKITIKMDLRFC